MSGSDLASNRDHFTVAFQQPPPPPPQFRLEYPAPAYQTPATNGGDSSAAAAAAAAAAPPQPLDGSASEPLKRKRGRPRKYGTDGVISPPPAAVTPVSQSDASGKKPRGRPRGSLNKKGSKSFFDGEMEGSGLTTHVLTVNPGEDLAAKIMVFSQSAPRNITVLSATGAISNATIRQLSSSGGTVTYEGRFEILSLVGSLLLAEDGSQHSRAGTLSITLSGPDGRVLGGAVEGLLIAAAPIQVVLASFTFEGRKRSKSAKVVSSSLSGGSESSGGIGSPLN